MAAEAVWRPKGRHRTTCASMAVAAQDDEVEVGVGGGEDAVEAVSSSIIFRDFSSIEADKVGNYRMFLPARPESARLLAFVDWRPNASSLLDEAAI